jgi:hypothetical protein
MPDADIVVHVDAATFVPNNYKALLQLENQPQIKSSPELLKMVRQIVAQVDGPRGMAKSLVGIDPVTDVTDATISLQIVPNADPVFLAAVHGKFSPASFDKIAKLTGSQPTKIGGGVIIEMGAQPAIGLTKDGVLLAGPPKLVRDRLADTWRAPARPAGGSLAHAAELIASKPVFAVALSMSPAARKFALDKHGPQKNFLTDIVQRHKVASFAIYTDGVGWTWQDRDKAGLEQMAQMSEGALELMRAAQIAPRGMSKIVLAGLESYRGTDKTVDQLLARKADLVKIVESFTGDGNFKVKIDKNPATFRLDVRATGKSLSEVLPAGFIVPMAAVGLFTGVGMKKKEAEAWPPPSSTTMPPPPPPGKGPAKQPAPPPGKGPAKQPAPGARP